MRSRIARIGAGVVVLLLVAVATVASRLPRVRGAAEQLIGQAGTLPADHWLAFSLGQVMVAACGILPASLMAVAAGAAYGMVDGLLLSAGCTLLGGWLAFLLSRSMLRPWIARWIDRYGASARFDEAIAREGWRFVCLLRISPVMPFAATSYGLGLTSVSQRDYLLGTLASLPALATYVSFGVFGRSGMALVRMNAGPMHWLLPAVGVATLFVAVGRLQRMLGTVAAPARG